jgi:hypothetical protein
MKDLKKALNKIEKRIRNIETNLRFCPRLAL